MLIPLESEAFAPRLRAYVARVIVVAGWTALFATSEPGPPRWTVSSTPVVVALDVPAFGERTLGFAVEAEEHPVFLEQGVHLRIDGPRGAYRRPAGYGTDASMPDPILPIVDGAGRALKVNYDDSGDRWDGTSPTYAYFTHPTRCTEGTTCARMFVVRIRAGASPITGSYTSTCSAAPLAFTTSPTTRTRRTCSGAPVSRSTA